MSVIVRCERLSATLELAACARRWTLAGGSTGGHGTDAAERREIVKSLAPCRGCPIGAANAKRQRRREYMLAYMRAWKKRNREKVRALLQKWRAANPEKVRGYKPSKRRVEKEKVWRVAYEKRVRARINERARVYYHANKAKILEQRAYRRAKKEAGQ